MRWVEDICAHVRATARGYYAYLSVPVCSSRNLCLMVHHDRIMIKHFAACYCGIYENNWKRQSR